MGEEPKNRLTRRQALTAAGTLGAGAAIAGAIAFGRLDDDDREDVPGTGQTTGPDPAGGQTAAAGAGGLAAGCVLTPSLTEGPYFVDRRFERSDIRGNQSGVSLNLAIGVLNVDADCAPYPGAVVDLWQCNAQGVYSDVSAPGSGDTVEGTWLRGLQRTDRNGKAKFTTIYPGWYPGRTVHIHLKVRTFQGSDTTYNFTSQLFFPEELTDQVMSDAAYTRSEPMTTTNANDGIFSSDLVLDLSGNTSDGYSGAIDIGLTGLPA